MSEVVNVVMLKKGGIAQQLAKAFNDFDPQIVFSGTDSEEIAAKTVLDGTAHLIVSGLVGVDWEYVLKTVGDERLIVYAPVNFPQDRIARSQVNNAGATFVEMRITEGAAPLLQAIIKKFPRD